MCGYVHRYVYIYIYNIYIYMYINVDVIIFPFVYVALLLVVLFDVSFYPCLTFFEWNIRIKWEKIQAHSGQVVKAATGCF